MRGVPRGTEYPLPPKALATRSVTVCSTASIVGDGCGSSGVAVRRRLRTASSGAWRRPLRCGSPFSLRAYLVEGDDLAAPGCQVAANNVAWFFSASSGGIGGGVLRQGPTRLSA